ncbi:MAG: hypothetical protein JOZ18_02410 [Chloroflexi bacterium]|nr:hypothetical protein [Chloroflexota bacterium]
MTEPPSQALKNFGREVPLDDIFAFYASLGLSRKLAYKPQSGAELLGAAWAVFSDGEINLPLGGRPLDPDIALIFGPQVPTQGSFYHALQAERRKVEQEPVTLSPAFEILQLHWGAHLAAMLAREPEILDRLGWYWRIQNRALAFAPERTQGGEQTLSQSISLSPLHLVIEIDPGVRGAFAVQRLYDGQWASPLQAHPFQYWAIHRNDFHAQFLSIYLDAYGQYLFDFWSQKRNQTDLVQAPIFLSTQLLEYLEYGESLGEKKDFGRSIRQDSGFVNVKGDPADEINKIVASHKERKLDYELVDLVVWTSRSVLQATEQELAATIRSVHTILRPGNGMLIGAPILQRPEDANLALQKVEKIAKDIFGERNVQNYLVNDTSSLLLSSVFMRKESSRHSQKSRAETTASRSGFTLALPQTLYQEMVTHVMNDYPHMACGMLGCVDGRVVKHYPTANVAANPKGFFQVGDSDMLHISSDLVDYDGEPVCYVSYPTSPIVYPSKSMIESMKIHRWPFIIFSLKQYPEHPSCRVFTVDSEGSVTEGKLELI